jgi:hypothetical protein
MRSRGQNPHRDVKRHDSQDENSRREDHSVM